MLFGLEMSGAEAEVVIRRFWKETPGDPEGRSYAEAIVRGVAAELTKIDETIQRASQNWRLERMARVDRNVLRVGTWELLSSPEVPSPVVLDEAVELAKRFGTEDSGAFVNGVLDRIAGERAEVEPPS